MRARTSRNIVKLLSNHALRSRIIPTGAALASAQRAQAAVNHIPFPSQQKRYKVDDHQLAEAKRSFVKLSDMGGYPEVVESLQDVIAYLKDPRQFEMAGLKVPKGVLLTGKPGVGKTRWAEAIAGEADVPMYMMSGSELVGVYVGAAELALRKLIEKIDSNGKPCVLVIDEIDSVGKRFESPRQGSELHANSMVNQLLSIMTQSIPGLVMIGTTNFKNMLDEALIRPGRFDLHVEVPMPNKTDRISILDLQLKKIKMTSAICTNRLADLSEGFSGARLVSWVQHAARIAHRQKSSAVTMDHMDQARSIMDFGTKGRVESDLAARRRTAIHEAGHAIVGVLLGKQLHKVSILVQGASQGRTEFVNHHHQYDTKQKLLKDIAVCLAGRAAEKLCGFEMTGSQDDISRAERIAKTMILHEGMGSTLTGVSPMGTMQEIEAMLKTQMEIAMGLLTAHKDQFQAIVNNLVEENEIAGDRVYQLLGSDLGKEDSKDVVSRLGMRRN